MHSIENETYPPGLLGGQLEGVQLPDLMWALCERRATGVLEISHRPTSRKLYLQDGRIVFATSSDPNDRLGEMLLRKGEITLVQLETALSNLRTGKRLGLLLVDAGALDSATLIDSVIAQVKAVVLNVLGWEEGEYRFEPGPLPSQEVITLQVHTAELLMQGIRNITSFSRIRGSVGPSQSIFGLTSNWRELREGLRLTEGERVVLDRLERGKAKLAELCEELTLASFEIYRALWAFKVLGLVAAQDPEAQAHASTILGSRRLRSSFAEILVDLSGSANTGVLYASRRSVERSFHLDGGRCVFATSTHPDDGLVSYLLRRGVISLRDREETRKRLLSNKRVGTILRDLGVLDAEDLTAMVREQLSEIVYDTFRWDDGVYYFAPGELPTNEQITLDADVAQLVSVGVRRVDSWTRVIQGCGGVDNPLRLDPGYLDLLDRMGAGVEEMEVANALQQPRSPRRICNALALGDFRICQILWSLKLLGGIETARVDLNEPVPEDLPTPEHIDAGNAAVGSHMVDSVLAALSELPDSADLFSRPAVDADVLPLLAPAASASLPAVASPSKQAPASAEPELLELETDTIELDEERPAADRPASVVADDEPVVDDPAALDLQSGPDPVLEELELDVDSIVEKFNAMHRLVYRAVRAEIGAGAVNFVRSCAGQAGDGSADLLEGVDLQPDGTWDVEALKKVISAAEVDDPWAVYQSVLDREFVLLAPHLGQSRAKELKERIWSLHDEPHG